MSWKIVHTRYGACVWGGTRNEISYSDEMYVCGYKEANHPVPAIRQGFEWGRELLTDEVVLMHWQQGVYGHD